MIRGKVWRFGDDVDTDAIIPGRYLDDYTPENLARHVMEGVDPSFASKVSRGDIIVAGRHFGIGSSREQAPIALKAAGVEVILAESFARIFYRNAVNLGMLPLICPGCSESFVEGETLSVDLDEGRAYVSSELERVLELRHLPPIIAAIRASGGLASMVRSELVAVRDKDK
jgi:3-isopropylmalate/(R)-2-methylmalate dehydratase small subunit